ncbi:MAG: hypothetical protein QW734_07545 [Candidatus Bathyarchaeia archaeon]
MAEYVEKHLEARRIVRRIRRLLTEYMYLTKKENIQKIRKHISDELGHELRDFRFHVSGMIEVIDEILPVIRAEEREEEWLEEELEEEEEEF